MRNDYPQRTAMKIRLRERGWKYDRRKRAWYLDLPCARVWADTMHAALALTIAPKEDT